MSAQFTALVALVRKDLILYFSNRRAVLVTVAAPIAIAAFFGTLFGNSNDKGPSQVPIAIVDRDGSALSKRVVADMNADKTFEVRPLDEPQAIDAVNRGKIRALVILPEKFGESAPRAMFGGRDKPHIEIRYDPSQAITLQVVQGLLAQHVMENVSRSAFSLDADPTSVGVIEDARRGVRDNPRMGDGERRDFNNMFDAIDRVRASNARSASTGQNNAAKGTTGNGAGMQVPYAVDTVEASAGPAKVKYNSYAHSFVGMGVQFILFMGIDLGIKLLTMRRQGLWQRLRAAPLSRGFLLASQVASGALIAAILFALIFAAGIIGFGVRVDGSFFGFVGMILAFALMTASFGLFIAALGKTPEATRGLAIFATLLMVMLGGAWVPSFIFPQWLQTVSLAMPTRWAVDGLDAMTWRGLGLDAAWVPIVTLLAFSLVFGVIAVLRFRWDEK